MRLSPRQSRYRGFDTATVSLCAADIPDRQGDIERTRHVGSEAVQKIEQDPRWKRLFAGYPFGVDAKNAGTLTRCWTRTRLSASSSSSNRASACNTTLGA